MGAPCAPNVTLLDICDKTQFLASATRFWYNQPMESLLEEFVCIVDAGSVSAAARQLGVPRASLGRRLVRLEESYGVQLLHRDTHRQTLTEAGNELYQRGRRIVAALAEARLAVSQLDDVPRGVLRFGMDGWASAGMMLTRAFRDRFPEVEVEVVTSHVFSDLLTDRIDVALTAGRIRDERLVARKLMTYDSFVYAAPSVLEGGLPTLETLGGFDCIVGFDGHGRPEPHWPLWNGGTIAVSGPVRADTIDRQVEGARQGLGLALLPSGAVADHVRSGALVPVLTEDVGVTNPVSLVWPYSDFRNRNVQAFVDLASGVLQEMARARDAQS